MQEGQSPLRVRTTSEQAPDRPRHSRWATVYTWKCSSLTIDVRSRQLIAVNRLGRGRLSAGSCAYVVQAWF